MEEAPSLFKRSLKPSESLYEASTSKLGKESLMLTDSVSISLKVETSIVNWTQTNHKRISYAIRTSIKILKSDVTLYVFISDTLTFYLLHFPHNFKLRTKS